MKENVGIRVLVVEDEQLIALQMRMDLKNAGYDVLDPVANGTQALESMRAEKPDIVFMDIHLPGDLDGIETARAIRKDHPIPIVFLTGYVDPEISEQLRQVGISAVLCKPVFIHQLEAAIKDVFKNQKSNTNPA
jgi:CheY-like chemotaxis protein